MAAQGNQPISQIEEDIGENYPQEEQSPQTEEDKLAAKLQEGGFTGEQQTTIQATLALLFGASTHALEIKHSLDLLRGEIDINKLVTDPRYKAEIERAVQLTNRYGRIVKKGELIDKVPRIERAIERTTACHSKLKATKSAMLANDKLYLQQLKTAYGLDDKQLKAITASAWAKTQENPSLSIKDALRIEAEGFSVKQVTKEIEQENRGKKLTKEEKQAQIEKKLTEKRGSFETSLTTTDVKTGETKSYADYENKKVDAIIKAQIEENKQILAAPPQPSPAPTPPLVITTPPPVALPPVMPPVPISLPPSGLTQGLGNMFGGLGKMFGGVGNGLKSILGRGGAFSKAFDTATRLGKMAINRGLDALLPGLGAAVGKINDVIKSIIGIDVEGTIVKGAVILVGAVAAIVIILPLIIGVGVFSYITGNNPLKLSSINERTIGWHEFNKQYLTINTADNNLTWQQFEQNNLTSQRPYLTLEKISR